MAVEETASQPVDITTGNTRKRWDFWHVLLAGGVGVLTGAILGAGVILLLDERSEPEVVSPPPRARFPRIGPRRIGAGVGSGVTPRFQPRLSGGGGQSVDETETRLQPMNEHVIIQREAFTANSAFHFEEPGRSMPVSGPGTLVNSLLVADSDEFGVYIELDGQTVIDASFPTLMLRSDELDRIAAYRRGDDKYVLAVSGYEFQEEVDVVIQPDGSLSVTLQRAEIDVVRGDE